MNFVFTNSIFSKRLKYSKRGDGTRFEDILKSDQISQKDMVTTSLINGLSIPHTTNRQQYLLT